MESNTELIPYIIGLVILVFGIAKGYEVIKGEGVELPAKSVPDKGLHSNGVPLKRYGSKQWLHLVNADTAYPHLFVVGKTRSGKTALTRAILAQRKGECLIIDPKATPGKWGTIDGIGLDGSLSYSTIEKALQSALEELKSRQRAMHTGQSTFAPLTIVIDELITIAMYSPIAAEVFSKVSVIGAELNVRLIAISQSNRVKPLGISGAGDIRDNFLQLSLGNKAREAAPNITDKYPCIAHLDNGPVAFDTVPVPTLMRQPLQLTGYPIPDTDTTGITDIEGGYSDTIEDTGIDTDTLKIQEMLQQGISNNKIAQAIGGNRNKTLAKIREVKQSLPVSE
jgi:hypothetical protein